MRSPARLVTGTASAALTVMALGLTTAAPSAYAGELGRLEITPASAAPGATVTVSTTACGPEGSGIGDANSLDAGDFEVRRGTHKESAVGQFTVPHDSVPGTYEIGVSCDNGKEAAGDLEVTAGGKHNPAESKPGHDRPSENDQPSEHDRPAENDRPSEHDQSSEHDRPSGHVKTGVGGSVRPDTTQIAAGVGVLGAATAGGVWLMRRRSDGTQGG
ncbi:hypothetical protein OG413_19145 [Streptomyces sp. NBC_01433]|uniref:hypothetical protein n=1 Tax=Streptomyces sp. NBC_01433 TaxID=2903864 RepID=UPI002251609D|nr:hypothetical protein [Streptomyces sp. NBC_01433]MCX4677393.1 hypothetical protein [Streptomyces sp. NBC_01433]